MTDKREPPKPAPLIEIPVGGAVEIVRAYRPDSQRDPTRVAASTASGFMVRPIEP